MTAGHVEDERAGAADCAQDAERGLVRTIGPVSFAASVVNLTVGSGIFVLPALMALHLGSAAILPYLVCSAAMLLVLLCLAEAGSRVTCSGGVYAYIETAFGPFAGFIAAFTFWFGFSLAADAAIAGMLAEAVASLWPGGAGPLARVAILVVLFLALAAINIVGVRYGLRLVLAVTAAKLLPLLALVVFALPFVSAGTVVPAAWPRPDELAQASLLLFFAFTGAESALAPAGEIRNPARVVPRGLLAGMAVILLLYVLVQVAAQSVLGSGLAGEAEAPLAAVAEALWGPVGRVLLVLCLAVSAFGTLSGDLLATPRSVYAAARDGLLPSGLAWVHPRYRTPSVSIAVFSALACLLSITGGFRALAMLSSASLLLVYLAAILAVMRLRRLGVEQSGTPFRLPGGPTVPLLAAAIVSALLVNCPWPELASVAALVMIASLAYAFRALLRGREAGSSA